MFGLLGPNGSGKTFDPDDDRDHGAGLGHGIVVWAAIPAQRAGRVGYLPEERGLYKKMKVLDQLVFWVGCTTSARPAAEQARMWCERLQISEALGRKPRTCPRGCSRRSSLLRRCCMIRN